ncbi:hypothetical protein BJP40_06385 [Streptomyces sp. CC53]|uniref:helix-turn-helix domain-containing protein n=1 Tax=Streptomyces sp. CC53 TaxID=1906740 RepID=UPI0008DD02AC|nr:helix-turn-helix domain-containing protein [Streptomyces sp. CC53]OII61150.1 hypothetical protein BJP40_06385 [Streptomyces sp. CC53]
MANEDKFMRPAEAARLFGVDTRTIMRWSAAGKLRSVQTLGGHRRYFREEVMRLWGEMNGDAT